MNKKKPVNSIKNYIQIAIGAMCYAVSVGLFLDPNALAPGGVTGIAMILSRVTSIPTGTWFMLINIPILLIGLWKFGLRFLVSTIYCIGMVTLFTNALAEMEPITHDRTLACVVGGTILAVGIGVIFKAQATTGGTDIIVKLLRLKFPHMKTGGLFLSIDAVIVCCSAFILKDIEIALYACVCIFLISRVLDFVLYGRDEAKLIYIISDHHEQISKRLLEEVDVGVTFVEGVGAYSGKDKKVIMCAVKKPLAPKTEDVVKEEDPQAFMIITSATEIYGERHKSYFSERL